MGERSEIQNTTSTGYRHTILRALLAEPQFVGSMRKQRAADAKRVAAKDRREISGDVQGSAELVSKP
jgi:hypothetical protein